MDFGKIKNIFEALAGLVAAIGFIIGMYIGYTDIHKLIHKNLTQIEKTQIMILKTKVREHEHNKCKVSDVEWDEYIENYSSLYELKKRHKHISKDTPWKPVLRVTNKTEDISCKK